MIRFSIFLLVIFIGCKSSDHSTEPDENQGCMDESAYNYNTDATVDDGSCAYSVDSPIIWNIYYETSTPIGGFQFRKPYKIPPPKSHSKSTTKQVLALTPSPPTLTWLIVTILC